MTVIGTGEFMSYNLSLRANICLISPAYVSRRQIISLEFAQIILRNQAPSWSLKRDAHKTREFVKREFEKQS